MIIIVVIIIFNRNDAFVHSCVLQELFDIATLLE